MTTFLTELKKQIWNKIKTTFEDRKKETTFADTDLFYFSSSIFKKKQKSWFHWRQPFRKTFIAEEELNDTDIDDIWNLEDLSWFVFIDEECGNLKVVNDDREFTRNINQKKKSDILQLPINVHAVTNVAGKSISSITIYDIVNHSGKHNFCCGSVVNSLKYILLIKWIEIVLTQFLLSVTEIVPPCRI